jgi:hypothetical protein
VSLSLTRPLRLALTKKQLVYFVNDQCITAESSQNFDQAILLVSDALRQINLSDSAGLRSTLLPKWLSALKPFVPRKRELALIIDNSWVRLFSCRWDNALKSQQEFVRYSEIEFERRFHVPLQQWTLVPDRLRPAGETLWCAYRSEQLTALEQMVGERNFRLQSLRPSIIAEVAALDIHLKQSPMIYVSAGDQSTYACWIEEGKIRDVMVVIGNASDKHALISTFAARLGYSPVVKVSILRLRSTHSEMIRSLVAGRALGTEVTMVGPVPEALETEATT